ncbi:adenine methyltransferase [Methylobacterium sp. WL19]|uniref:adenine methyltransferase n=1 Tax=Methylobacterium sp. WL19 TaxID=2603896 RepID=UPI0011CC1B39|nr:adenine methyltransferase [Methylobacterium sp. WL19]TXN22070.1 adenine methyltransferase [Methylobacterium sp. WL19]
MGYWDTPGRSDEWYTPPQVFDALGCRFDLDVTPARYGTADGARLWAAEQEDLRRQQHDAAVALGLAKADDFQPATIPASLPASDHTPADRQLQGDGLVVPWAGFVWMNPPFGGRNGIEPWLDRFFDHGNGIALAPDRTSAPWFWKAWQQADRVLFTRKIRFLRPDGTEGVSPSNGTALFAVGVHGIRALKNAAGKGFGILAAPQNPEDQLRRQAA